MKEHAASDIHVAAVCEAGDLNCGNGLLLIIRKAIEPLLPGEVLEIRSRDHSVGEDLPAWCRMTANELVGATDGPGSRSYRVRKGAAPVAPARDGTAPGALDEDMEKARAFTWSARIQPSGERECRMYSRNQTITVGPPVDFGFGGGDAPLSAVEHLLGSLGACLLMGYRMHASRRNITVDQIELAVRGGLGNPLVALGLEDQGYPGLARVSATLYVSAEADEQALRSVWEETLRRSPVLATIRASVECDLKLSVLV